MFPSQSLYSNLDVDSSHIDITEASDEEDDLDRDVGEGEEETESSAATSDDMLADDMFEMELDGERDPTMYEEDPAGYSSSSKPTFGGAQPRIERDSGMSIMRSTVD